jgi:L-iditol 2-dehydrogenase
VIHGLSLCERRETAEAVVLGAGPIGLMFVAELCRVGTRVVLGDIDPGRLELGADLGAGATVLLEGDASDAMRLREATADGRGAGLAVDATGTPAGWASAIDALRTGGSALLFGGCPPGTTVELDSHRVHYSEIAIHGAYHHRPATVEAALDHLARRDTGLERLIQDEQSLEGVERALRRMAAREILKAAIRPHDSGGS